MSKVKLCGMFRAQDIEAVAAACPDYVGFIVDFPRSHRSVSVEQLTALCQQLDALRGNDAERLCKVGVFVDKPAAFVANTAQQAGLELVQLHGHEDEAYIAELRPLLPAGCAIIQAFRVRSAEDVARAQQSSADYLLLDSGQGSGEGFDHSLVQGVSRPFFLAGGLGPENVAAAIAQTHPYAVDMSSDIETNKQKDPAKMAAAVAAARTIGDD